MHTKLNKKLDYYDILFIDMQVSPSDFRLTRTNNGAQTASPNKPQSGFIQLLTDNSKNRVTG